MGTLDNLSDTQIEASLTMMRSGFVERNWNHERTPKKPSSADKNEIPFYVPEKPITMYDILRAGARKILNG
jgi:hypothetical protein